MSSSSTTCGHVGHVADRLRPDALADLLRVGVEDGDDAEAVVGEDVARRDGPAEVARAEQRDVVLAGRPEDLADLRDERLDVVADPALAELAEAGQVATDLGRVDVRVVAELLRGDRLLAHLLGLREDLQVAGEAGGDAERQAVGAAGRRCRLRQGERVASPTLIDGPPYRARPPAGPRRGRARRGSRRRATTTGIRSSQAAQERLVGLDVDLLERRAQALRMPRASSHRWQPGRPKRTTVHQDSARSPLA